jgi:hypothetical protein
MSGPLRIRPVWRYRQARYPSLHPGVRAKRSRGRTALLAAALPVAAGGVGTLQGCLWTTSGDLVPGDYMTRYFTEAEARAILLEEIATATGSPADPCAHPTIAERALENRDFAAPATAGRAAVTLEVDLLAPAVDVPPDGTCPGGPRPAVGFEFATSEANDDEDLTLDPNGLTAAETTALGQLRTAREAAVVVLQSADFVYHESYDGADVAGSDGGITRAEAEMTLRERVRQILTELQGEGLL